MTEAEYIALKAAKDRRKFLIALRHVARFGEAPSRWWNEALTIGDYIMFSPPRDNFRFNHYRLTERGQAELSAA